MTPTRKANKSATALLCELTRLKTQQKIFESAEYNLNIDYSNKLFLTTISIQGNSAFHISNQIKQTRIQLVHEQAIFLGEYREIVNYINFKIKEIKQNLLTERIHQYSMEGLRQHIVSINTEIERMKLNNNNKLLSLQKIADDSFFPRTNLDNIPYF